MSDIVSNMEEVDSLFSEEEAQSENRTESIAEEADSELISEPKPLVRCNCDCPAKLLKSEPVEYDFTYVGNLAMAKIRIEFTKLINIAINNFVNDLELLTVEHPHRVFSWAFGDFLNRMKVNHVWVDLFMLEYDTDQLNKLKLRFDLEELLRYFELVVSQYDENSVEHSHIMENVKIALNHLNIMKNLREEMKWNKSEFKRLEKLFIATSIFKEDKESNEIKEEVYLKLWNFESYNPIELRYQLNYIKYQVAKVEFSYKKAEDDLNKKIEEYKNLGDSRQFSHSNIMNMFYVQVENYKHSITNMTLKMECEYEDYDCKNAELKLVIEKLEEKFKSSINDLIRFRREIEEIRQEEIARRQEEIRRRLMLEEELALQARLELEKKKNKKKKNKKKK